MTSHDKGFPISQGTRVRRLCPRRRREGGIVKWAAVSVCLSRASTYGERKDLGSLNLARWKRITVNLFRGQKVKVTTPTNAHTVGLNAQYLPNRKAYTNIKLGIGLY